MKIAVIHFSESSGSKVVDTAKAVARGLDRSGKSADLIDGYRDVLRLSVYTYLCICCEGTSFFTAGINADLAKRLEQATGLSGKRACVLVQKKLFWPDKTMQKLLRAVESQGVYLRNSLVADKNDETEAFAARLDVEPNRP